MEKILEAIASLFNQLDLPRKWFAILSTFLIAILGIILFEWATGYFYYRSLEKKVALLKELQTMANSGIITNTILYPVYESTAKELAVRQIRPAFSISLSFANPVILGKAISGALFFGSLAIAALFNAFGEKNKVVGAIFCIFLAVLAGYLSTLVPTIWNPWVNYIGSPVIQLLAILLIGGRMKKTTSK